MFRRDKTIQPWTGERFKKCGFLYVYKKGSHLPYYNFEKTIDAIHLPPITLSIACSKCFWFIASERCLAAIKAASLQTLAISAPESREGMNYTFSTIFSHSSIKITFSRINFLQILFFNFQSLKIRSNALWNNTLHAV